MQTHYTVHYIQKTTQTKKKQVDKAFDYSKMNFHFSIYPINHCEC